MITDELSSLLVSILSLESNSVLGNGELRTEELSSLVLEMRTSIMDVLKKSGSGEEPTLLGVSGISIGVVTGVKILLLLKKEVVGLNSLLSNGTEPGSCVGLTRAGLDVELNSTLLSLNESRPEDDERSDWLNPENCEADKWDSALFNSVVSASWEEYDDEPSGELKSEEGEADMWDSTLLESVVSAPWDEYDDKSSGGLKSEEGRTDIWDATLFELVVSVLWEEYDDESSGGLKFEEGEADKWDLTLFVSVVSASWEYDDEYSSGLKSEEGEVDN